MAVRKTKFVGPLYLAPDEYARLERDALAEERDALQHARWLLRQALDRKGAAETQPSAPAEAGAAT